jgi:plastocyanin domain-containing protein
MNKIAYIILLGAIVVALGIVFSKPPANEVRQDAAQPQQNVEIRDGVQYITITARAGYSPKVSSAQAGIPTKLVIRTNGTYDCSLALVIRSIGYQKILSQTGEETIDLGIPEKGTLQGTCSMGMYNFKINFE